MRARFRAAAAAAATIATALATTLTMTTASARPVQPQTSDTVYQGRVTASFGLINRKLPITDSPNVGVSRPGPIDLACKVRGPDIAGNDIWYRRPHQEPAWVSARYVGSKRTAMLYRSQPFDIRCKVRSHDAVAGNDLWYQLPEGGWVAAYYVDNVGKAPGYCH